MSMPRVRVFGNPGGEDAVIDQAVRALQAEGLRSRAEEMLSRLDSAPASDHLFIISEYVEDC